MAFDKLVDSAKLEMEMTATAVAIRNKTGLTDTIPWEDNTGFANAVAAITVGGGSSEDVRYVTFFNEDGTIEYGKKAVATGDDCADPIARGVFDTPTKESTAQYNYTFGGWATTPGGGIDANALKAVTEDRTVYANFISVLLYYTITYYDSDGVTVLKTESLAYGSTPSYAPRKDGYVLNGWIPELAAVTCNTSYTAQWRELNGISSVVTIPKTLMDSGEIRDVAINNAGTLVLALFSTKATKPLLCHIVDGTASLLDTSAAAISLSTSECEYGYDDSYFFIRGYNSSLTQKLCTFDVDGTGVTLRTTSDSSSVRLACSPVADETASLTQISGSTYKLNACGKTLSNVQGGTYTRFSPDGSRLVLIRNWKGYSNAIVDVYKTADLTLEHAILPTTSANAKKASFSEDGKLLAVSFDAKPFLVVYETTNYTEVANFSTILSASTRAELIGENWLIAGSGTTVQGYLITDNGIKTFADYNLDLPAYTGGTIEGIEKNHIGNRLVLWDSDKFEVWAKN